MAENDVIKKYWQFGFNPSHKEWVKMISNYYESLYLKESVKKNEFIKIYNDNNLLDKKTHS